jgi:uridylate kinase
METKNWTVISLGGSLIAPKEVDAEYLKSFASLIKNETANGSHFAIITGGGHIAREYRDALIAAGVTDNTELDLVGIAATRMNAVLLQKILGSISESEIFLDPTKVLPTDKLVMVGGGWKPGHSSDGAAVGLAKQLGATKLINLSNIEYVYTADPRTNPEAAPIEKISWDEFRKLLPTEWSPGINAPFDPIAAKMAQEMNLEVAVMNGKNLENLKNYLDGKEFVGTVIS